MDKKLLKLNNKLITRLPDCDLQEIENFIKTQRQEIIDEIEIKEKVIIQTLRNIDTDEDTIRDIIDVFTDLK